ncbi:MAG: hypothetical protein ACPHDT_15620 [Acidimicrobiales bacterium]
MSDSDDLHAAFVTFVDSLEEAEHALRLSSTFAREGEPSRGYQHLLRSLLKSIERELVYDPVRPRFRVLDDRIRSGGDNPDQQYWFAHIEQGGRYRVVGRLGSAKRLEMQLYAREPYGAEDVSVAYLTHEEIAFDAEGHFAVELGPGHQLDTSEATMLQVREIYDAWDPTEASRLVIEVLDAPGAPMPRSARDICAIFERAGLDLQRSTEGWPSLVAKRILDLVAPNAFTPLQNPGRSAGVEGRWMAIGPYELVDHTTAIVVSLSDAHADYVGIQLADLWMASLEYADATSSRTGSQSHRAPDGRLYHIVSLSDPGYRNWLDPVGLTSGLMHVRLDGLGEAMAPEHQPRVTATTVAELPDVIPGFDDGVVTPDGRADELAQRRRHVQLRFGR